MGVIGRQPLRSSLAMAGVLAASQDDPYGPPGLHLNLPKLNGAGATLPTPAQLRSIAALYLQAELEQAGVIPLVEAMVEMRDTLPYLNSGGAGQMEEFHRRQEDWYARTRREQLFGRVFGLGRGAVNGGQESANHGFQQYLASFCMALVAYADDQRWGQHPGPQREAGLRFAALALLGNLGPATYGNTQAATQLIQQQLQRAIDLLNNPEIGAVFQAQGMWDTMRKAYGAKVPDLGRFITRGQSGMRLLNWLAEVLTQFTGRQPAPVPAAPVFTWAASWLQASGLALDRVAV